jgi:hypothetical protein
MKQISKLFLIGMLALGLLTTACAADEREIPIITITTLPSETSTQLVGLDVTMAAETAIVSNPETTVTQVPATASPVGGTTITPAIPVTGLDIVLVECQFCVDTMAHALLVMADTATFEFVSATTTTTSTLPTNCSTIEVNNGKQVVLCSGPENTTISLNICTNTCTNLPVNLMSCPVSQTNNTSAATTNALSTPESGTGSATSTFTITPETLPSLSLTPTP